MLNYKILLIQKEFIKLNSNTLFLGVFTNIKDFFISAIPTANFWINALTNNISIAAIDKFSLALFTYFTTLYTTAFTLAQLQHQKYADKIDNIISQSLYWLTGDHLLSTSNITLLIVKLVIVGIIFNIIIAVIFRRRMQRNHTSKFYQQFEDQFNAEFEKYTKSSSNISKNGNQADVKNYQKTSKFSQLLLYLHNIRVLNIADINALLADQELLAAKLGLRNIKRAEIQEQMLKYLDIMALNKALDPNMRNLKENIILNSKNHPHQDSLFTTKMLEKVSAIMPDFQQFLKQTNFAIKDFTSLAESFNKFAIGEIKNMQNNITQVSSLFSDPQKEKSPKPLKEILTEAKIFIKKLTKVYNMLTTPLFGSEQKSQKIETSSFKFEPSQNLSNKISSFQTTTSKSIDTIQDIIAESNNEIKPNIKTQKSDIPNNVSQR